jgi:hypothetical protein
MVLSAVMKKPAIQAVKQTSKISGCLFLLLASEMQKHRANMLVKLLTLQKINSP